MSKYLSVNLIFKQRFKRHLKCYLTLLYLLFLVLQVGFDVNGGISADVLLENKKTHTLTL